MVGQAVYGQRVLIKYELDPARARVDTSKTQICFVLLFSFLD